MPDLLVASHHNSHSWCIVSGATDGWAPAKLCFPTHVEYASRFRMDVLHWEIDPTDLHPSWHKTSIMRDALNQGYDWVVWVDADAAFVDMTQWIPWRCGYPIVLAQQRLGAWTVPSMGVCAVSGSAGLAFLDAIDNLQLAYKDHPWWDQAAVYELLGYSNEDPHKAVLEPTDRKRWDTEWTDRVGYLPLWWHGLDGGAIYHAAGSDRDKVARLASVIH